MSTPRPNHPCHDVEIEPYLQPVAGYELNRGAKKASDAHLDVHCCGFWERQRAAFFAIRVCHPNADSYKELTSAECFAPRKRFKNKEEKKRRC